MNRRMQLISSFQLMILHFALTPFLLLAQVDQKTIHGWTYARKDARYFTVSENKLGPQIVPTRIVVRRTDSGGIQRNDFFSMGIPDAELEFEALPGGYLVLKAPNAQRGFEIAEVLSSSNAFDYVAFDCYGELLSTPNDQFYSNQWNQERIHLRESWNLVTGYSSTILGIIDTGCDITHPDIAPNLWTGIGHDYVDGDEIPGDNFGHGTHVTGIVGARCNNTIGVAGVAGGWNNAPGVSLMIMRAGDQEISIVLAAIAIRDAAEQGAKVINISAGWAEGSPGLSPLLAAIDYAVDIYDVVVVAAAGNNGGGNSSDKSIRYPARFAKCIAVGAMDQNDYRWTTAGKHW